VRKGGRKKERGGGRDRNVAPVHSSQPGITGAQASSLCTTGKMPVLPVQEYRYQ
jgi:hypothetical protein